MSDEDIISELEQTLNEDYKDAIELLREIAASAGGDEDLMRSLSEGLVRVDDRLVRLSGGIEGICVEGLESTAPLLRPLTREEMARFEAGSDHQAFNPGDIVIQQGDLSDSLYIIKQGKAIVTVTNRDSQTVIATLTDGDFFGEMAMLTSKPRTATVRALTDLVLMRVDRQNLGRVIQAHPDILMHLAEQFARRIEALRRIIPTLGRDDHHSDLAEGQTG